MKNNVTASRTVLLALATCLTLTGCVKPRQTTGISAAAGGALGAGLGAIIGNQTGNAGSGMAIGAVAGAATGALVGNAIQAQKETTDAQSEAMGRQERTVRAQRSEIAELRRMQSDTSIPGQSSNVNAYLVEQKRLVLQKRGPSPRGQQDEGRYAPPPLPATNSEPLARYDIKTSSSPLRSAPLQQAKQEKPLTSQSKAGSLQEKNISGATTAQVPALPAAETTTAKTALKTEPESPCEEGRKVREAATSTSEDSEKLFHLRKALRLCPNSAETHYELGKTYLGMDRAADASYEFKQALSINPKYQPAKESLEGLDQGHSHY